ncbi:MAG TPA: glycosyltransferase [Microbacteriaceae bacterium]|jgi:glycosyltransferase involved in cell wall biosynthesis|nr:glycosyltransferase [Microbacteriaceae bacterium]
MHVAYVTWGEWGSGVYASQVLELVAELQEHAEVDLAVLLSRRSRASMPAVPGVHFLDGPVAGRWPIASFRLRSRGLRRLLGARRAGVVHCRGPLATIAASRARSSGALIHDYRGLDAAELEAESGSSWFTTRMAGLERDACRIADRVSVVSEPLRRHVIEAHGVAPENVVVIPTAADVGSFAWDEEARVVARASLGISGRIVAYVGSAADWQMPELCVAAAMRVVAQSDATFVVLSQDESRFRELVQRYQIPAGRVLIRTVSRAQLHRCLCAADVALLPRTPSVVNRVASPVKYAEYLAAGVPVVTVRDAGPFAAEVERLQLGRVVDKPDAEELAAAALALLDGGSDPRERCRRAASAYDLSRIAGRYLELYHGLAPG